MLRYGAVKDAEKRRTPALSGAGVQEECQRVLDSYIPGDPGRWRSVRQSVKRIDRALLAENEPERPDSAHHVPNTVLPCTATGVDVDMARARWVREQNMEVESWAVGCEQQRATLPAPYGNSKQRQLNLFPRCR